jgi:hypothetical protein
MPTSAEKMSEHRNRLRARGLRPVQRWVPDLRDPRIADEVSRAVREIKRRASGDSVDRLLDQSLGDVEGWT